jgi:O-antigen/teichoic acid export membrane protein
MRVPNKAELVSIVDISAFSTVIYALNTLATQGMLYVIGSVLPVAAVGAYAIGGTLPQYVNSLTLPVAQQVLSEASHLDAQGKRIEMSTMLLRMGRIGGIVLFAPLVGFFAAGQTFLGLWMGAEYREASGVLLLIFSCASLASLSRHVIQTTFMALGVHRSLVRWYAIEAMLVLAGGLLTVRQWGVVGVATAYVVPTIATGALVLPRSLSRRLPVSLSQIYREWYIRPIVALAPFGMLLRVVDHYFPATGYLHFFAEVALCLPAAAVPSYWLALDGSERLLFWQKIRLLTRLRSRPIK